MNFNESYINLNNSYEYNLIERVFIGIILSTICLIGVFGNVFVLIVAIRKQNYKFVTNCYIINLAITDLLFLLISVPITIYLGLTNKWILSNLIDCQGQIYIAHVLLQATCYTLAAMSIDRYLYVRSSHPRPRWRTPTNALIICIFIWIISIVFVFPYKWIVNFKDKQSNDCTLITLNPLFASCYFTLFAFYIFPLLIIAFCYTKLCFYMRNISKSMNKYEFNENICLRKTKSNLLNSSNRMLKRRRITRTLLSLTCLFAICWLPIHILELLNCKQMLENIYLNYSSILNGIRITAHALSYLNSCLNPVLYALFNKDFFL